MRAARRSRLSETDLAEWASYVQHVRTLPGRTRPAMADPASKLPPQQSPAARALPVAAPPRQHPSLGALVIGSQPPGVDNATWQRFRTGKLAASRTLDLHGRTAQRAYQALVPLLRGAHAEGLRCVEIITGRGSGETGGVLRRELPLWLNLPELRPLILAASHPHAANPGSVRLLLRRARPG